MSGDAPSYLKKLRYVRLPETSRYKPEQDEQLLGYDEILRRTTKSSNVPIAPTTAPLPCVYCVACETSWLQGFGGRKSAEEHPSHHTLFHACSWQSRRSMVVSVDGACSDDGAPSGTSSFGVFFDPESPNNLSSIANTPSPTKQTAEIVAAARAVRHVRTIVRPKREEIVRAHIGIHLEDFWQVGWTTPRLERHRNNWIFRLTVVTESVPWSNPSAITDEIGNQKPMAFIETTVESPC